MRAMPNAGRRLPHRSLGPDAHHWRYPARMHLRSAVAAIQLLYAATMVAAIAEPRADPDYRPAVADPAFLPGKRPAICLDEAHHNFHRLAGLFKPFADLLTADGYQVSASAVAFDRAVPGDCDVLVIANAQPNDAPWDAYSYPTPAAFDTDEVHTLTAWVAAGGRLLLIADHMPFPGATASPSRSSVPRRKALRCSRLRQFSRWTRAPCARTRSPADGFPAPQ
jgi:hypothetical protein